MSCCTCRYKLIRLGRHRCSECGRAYDTDDSDSFDASPHRTFNRPLTPREIATVSRIFFYGPLIFILDNGAMHPAILSMIWFVVFTMSIFRIGSTCFDAQESGTSAALPIAAWWIVVVGCFVAVAIASQM